MFNPNLWLQIYGENAAFAFSLFLFISFVVSIVFTGLLVMNIAMALSTHSTARVAEAVAKQVEARAQYIKVTAKELSREEIDALTNAIERRPLGFATGKKGSKLSLQ